MKPSHLSPVEFIKFLNARKGWHGNQYRTACGQWLANQSKTMKCKTCGARRLDSGCFTSDPCDDCETGEGQPVDSPAIGTIFKNGVLGECVVTKVWESRFGDWKISFRDEKSGGGIINLGHFNQTIAIQHAEEAICGPRCDYEDHRRYASRGKCALCGVSFFRNINDPL